MYMDDWVLFESSLVWRHMLIPSQDVESILLSPMLLRYRGGVGILVFTIRTVFIYLGAASAHADGSGDCDKYPTS